LNKRPIAALVGVVVLALIAAGCGSSGDGNSSSSSDESASTLTKAEFIKQSDGICEQGNKEVESEAEAFAKENGIDTSKPTTAEQEEVVSQVVAPAIQRQAEEIDAVGAPSGDEDEVEAIVEAVEAGAGEAEEDPSTIVEGKTSGPFTEANKLATEYGLKICGQ
jgi:hypothetical protein